MDFNSWIPGVIGAGATAIKGLVQDGGKVKALLGFTLGISVAVIFVEPILHITGLDKSIYYGVLMFSLGYGGASILDACVEALQKALAKKIGGGE